MTRIWTGTASVIAGYTTVAVVSGDPLSDVNCPADASMSLDGRAMHVAQRTGTATFEMTSPWMWDDGTYLLEIDPLTPGAISLLAISTQISQYEALLELLDANGRGLFYKSLGFTGANDPGPGFLGRDAADWADLGELYFDIVDQNGQNIEDQLALMQAGDIVIVRQLDNNAVVRTMIRAAPTNETGWYRARATYLGGSGIVADNADIAVEWRRAGVGLEFNTQVATPADLYVHEGELPGFKVLVSDTGSGLPGIYTLIESGSPALWAGPAVVTLSQVLSDYVLASYTVGALPSASPPARLIYVSDGSSNRRLAVSDGTDWRFPDGTIVA